MEESGVGGEKKEKEAMSYEKLLLLAKQLKALNKRINGEKDVLEKELKEERDKLREKERERDREKEEKQSQQEVLLPSSSSSSAPAPAPTPVSAELFWELIGTASTPALHRKLGHTSLRALVHTLGRTSLGQRRLLLYSDTSAATAFTRWKRVTANAVYEEQCVRVEEGSRARKELEVKVGKLKALLSRSHTSNKQQQEDNNAFRKAQASASQESRSQALEKQELLEQMRVRDIESAFHQDIELCIQRAAEEIHLRSRTSILQDTQGAGVAHGIHEAERDVAGAARSTLGDTTNQCLLQKVEVLQEEMNTLRHSLEQDESAKKDHEKIAEQLRSRVSSLEKEVVDQSKTVAALRGTLEGKQRELSDERCLRQEVELELELTTKTRADTLKAADKAWAEKHGREMRLASENMQQLRSQCEQLEHRRGATQSTLENTLEENSVLRAANSRLQVSGGETRDLRSQLAQLRRKLARGGIQLEGSGTAKAKKDTESVSVSRHNQITAETAKATAAALTVAVTKLSTAGMAACNRARECADIASTARTNESRERNTLYLLLHRLLALVSSNVGGSVPKHITSPSSPDYILICDKLRSKHTELLASLAAAEEEDEAQKQKQEHVDAEVQKEQNNAETKPMTWESTNVDLSSGRSIDLVIPLPAYGKATLRWMLSGGASGVTMSLTSAATMGNDAQAAATQLNSAHRSSDGAYIGEICLDMGEDAKENVKKTQTRLLRITNGSWSSTSLGYLISLTVEAHKKAIQQIEGAEIGEPVKNIAGKRRVQLQEKIKNTARKLSCFERGCELFFQCTRFREWVLQQEIEFNQNRQGGVFRGLELRQQQQEALEHFSNLISAIKAERHVDTSGDKTLTTTTVPTTDTGNTTPSMAYGWSFVSEKTMTSAPGFSIKASDSLSISVLFEDFRLPIRLKWYVELHGTSSGKDIGFSILHKKRDGSLPQVIPYAKNFKFVGEIILEKDADSEEGVVILIDNAYSWMNEKFVNYEIEIDSGIYEELKKEEEEDERKTFIPKIENIIQDKEDDGKNMVDSVSTTDEKSESLFTDERTNELIKLLENSYDFCQTYK